MIHKLLRLSLTSIGAVTSSTRYNTETFIHSRRELNSCHRLCEAGPLRREYGARVERWKGVVVLRDAWGFLRMQQKLSWIFRLF